MEKQVDVLGATAKLQIHEANCGGFCSTTPRAPATGLNLLEPAIDSRRAGMSGLVWIGFDTAGEGLRTRTDKLFYKTREPSLAGGDECAARGARRPRARTTCMHVQFCWVTF